MSTVDTTLTAPIRPFFTPASITAETPSTLKLITKLHLQKHPEGGYFLETDRDPLRVPNPFRSSSNDDDSTRAASTTIYYLLTPASPMGHFHRNKGRTMHTLHRGRGRYVIIHGDETGKGEKARVETFVVGNDIHGGERMQWLVEGGKYKASFLLPDVEGRPGSEGLLISETVVPGFEFSDHNFMPAETLPDLLPDHQADELRWLLPPAE
ncbi:MAG: hypothetical protein ASARMPREDX12_001597 [Alectoria sarmentosa]|nr:MAG: hypothetical protein ASARMPREDX12_001597 [Alectoria sarmentosa]CAD6578975.1 MAG: hypothetical protein ASARMPRED_008912 [Alectoria sarmentosa]